MRFGVREICNVVLRAKATQTLGNRKFYKGEPVLYFDTLKTSSLEGAATTVYATGGRGNSRLIAWEGERTLTFTMEDALISPEGFSILSGAGLIPVNTDQPIYVHTTSQVQLDSANTIELPEIPCWNGFKDGKSNPQYESNADIFVMVMQDGEIVDEPCIPVEVDDNVLTCYGHHGELPADTVVLVDYYVRRTGGAQVIEITADKFGGNYYLEADTLFRRESDGVDMPAEFIIPNCKVQSNFTFTMASSGDPSTFTFTMDAFPDYTRFDKTHKVLATIQMISDASDDEEDSRTPCVKAPFESYSYTDVISEYGDMPIRKLYRNDVQATPDENDATMWHVTGTFKPVTKWAGLPQSSWQSAIDATNGSLFYTVKLPESARGGELAIYTKETLDSKYSTAATTGTIDDQEMFWVLNVTKKPVIKFVVDDETLMELDFTKIRTNNN